MLKSGWIRPGKARRSCELFYLFSESARRAGASLRAHLAAGGRARRLAPEALGTHRWLEEGVALREGAPGAPPVLDSIPFRPGAIRVLVSDLLFAGDPDEWLHILGRGHGCPVVVAPFIRSEAEPDWQGNYEFVDVETHTRHPHRIEPAVLRRYRDAYVHHFATWKAASRRFGAAFARVDAGLGLEAALHAEAVPSGALEVNA